MPLYDAPPLYVWLFFIQLRAALNDKAFMIKQRTIKQSVKATGIGLHKGGKVTLTLRPAAENTGIIFRRVDLQPAVDIKVNPELVTDTTMCTCLTDSNGVGVATIEHLMSAMSGLGIDNIIAELDAFEVPIMDGSASPFIFLLQEAGIEEQNAAKKFIRVSKNVRVEDGEKWAEFKPYNGFKVDFKIDFNHPIISSSNQHVELDFDTKSYVKEISRARTFGFMRDLEFLRANNLALGGSMLNAVAMDDFHVLNPEGLRYGDEFVKHKILDAIGDLFVAGHNIIGEMMAYKSGHGVNNLLIRELMKTKDAWEFVTFDDERDLPVKFNSPLHA